MANEISYTCSLAVAKGGLTVGTGYASGALDMAGDDMLQASQTIQSGTEALNLGDVATPGVLYVKNLEASGEVLLSYASNGSSPFAKVRALAPPTVFQPASVPVYAQATVASRLAVAVASV